jgi:hypothetical protein
MAHIGNAPPSFFTAVSSDVFSANGTATSFSLSKSISNLADLELVVDNIQQNPFGGSYSVSGSTLTFSEAPAAGSNNVVVTYRQATIGSTIPTPNTVGNNSLQSNLSLTGTTTTQHVVPSANITYDLGTSTMRYRDLYLSGGTITLGDVTLTTNGSTFSVANTTGGVLPSALGNTTVTGTLTTSNNVVVGNSTVNTSINSTSLTTGSNTATIGTAAYVVANGNVGIGTPSPGYKVDVILQGIAGVATAARFGASGNGGSGRGSKIIIGAPGLSNLVEVAEIVGYQNSANSTANNAGLAFNVANTSGALTERARFNSTGALVFAGGTTTADGIGITFPATQSASSDANTLDDYEEGTWTPAITTSGGGFSTTYNTQLGTYVKVGRLVTVWLNIIVGTKSASGSGYLQLTGLPFNIASGISEFGGSVGMSYLWSSNPCICIQPSAGTSTVILNYTFTNNNCSGTDITSGSYFRATVTYQSNA